MDEIIQSRVDKVLKSYQYEKKNSLYVDAVKLANFFGFMVYEDENLNANVDGSLFVSDDFFNKVIRVNDYRTLESKRFSIVKLLSYYLLYYNNDTLEFNYVCNSKEETEESNYASIMARSLLIPVSTLNSTLEKYNGDISFVSKIYGVSEEDFCQRLEDINILCNQKIYTLKKYK